MYVAKELLKQLLSKKFTNLFPSRHLPSSVTRFINDVKSGKAKINPVVKVPDNFRGKIEYDKNKCIGCRLCIKVCPSFALEFKEKERKIKYWVTRCTFCGQCIDVCPRNALRFTDKFLLATDEAED